MQQPDFGGEEILPTPIEEPQATTVEQPTAVEQPADQPDFGGETIEPKAEPKGGVIDYLLNPREEVKDTEGFKAGEANVNDDTTDI